MIWRFSHVPRVELKLEIITSSCVFTRVPLIVSSLVCQHYYTKTTELIYTKFGCRMGLHPEYPTNIWCGSLY